MPLRDDIGKEIQSFEHDVPNERRTPQSRTYTENDIATIFDISPTWDYKLTNSGLLKTIRIGNMVRISRKSFEDWLKMEELGDETR